MRNFIDIIETTLYRGDAKEVEAYSFGRTEHGLFGRGIYLTDNPEIAKDYTTKGDEIVFTTDTARNQKEAVSQYIEQILTKRLNVASHVPDKYEIAREIGLNVFGRTTPEEMDRLTAEVKRRWDETLSRMIKEAIAIFKQERKEMSIFKDTLGIWHFMKSRGGHLSTFEIPEDYLARCLHGDAPLTDRDLNAIKNLIYSAVGRSPNSVLDMRNSSGKVLNFDDWVEAFRTTGISYAWDDDGVHDRGGKGLNPSLDTIINGTHSGFSWMYDERNSTAFVAEMTKLGYVGIEYNGGTRVGAHVRGGGGIQHRAYVLWDEKAVNQFRTDSTLISFSDIDADVTRGLSRRKSLRRAIDAARLMS